MDAVANVPVPLKATLCEKEYFVFVVSLTYKNKLSEVEKHIDAHIAYLEKFYVIKMCIKCA